MNGLIENATQLFTRYPWVGQTFWAVIVALITHLISRIASRAVAKLLHHDSNPLPTSSIIINIVRASIWIVGGSIVLSCYGIDTNALITALGVGGIAISLGFQDTLSNLIGGLQVTFMGIVKPGDNIEVGSQAGVVQDVTWRHATIRDAMGQTVIVPNSIISKNALVHLLPANRVAVPFAVPRALIEGIDSASAMDALAAQLAKLARDAAQDISSLTSEPVVSFSEVTELGIKGKIVFQIADATTCGRATDAVVRAIVAQLG